MPARFVSLLLVLAQVVSVQPSPVRVQGKLYRAQQSPTCGEWGNGRAGTMKDGDFYLVVAKLWIRGYVSGFNVYGPDASGNLLSATTHEEVETYIDAYCKVQPGGSIADALRLLSLDIVEKSGQSVAVASKPVRRKAIMMVAAQCADWTKVQDDKILRLAHGSAVRGFLTAYNLYRDPAGDVIGSGDDDFVDQWIDGWCSSRPDALLVSAIYPLTQHLAAERAAGRLPPGGKRPTDVLRPATGKGGDPN